MRKFVARRSGRGKLNYVWSAAGNDGWSALAANTSVAAASLTVADGSSDATIKRIRGHFAVSNNTAGFNQLWGAVGIIKVQDLQVGTLASMPTPFTNPGYDWLWHHFWSFANNGTTVANFYSCEIDSKAQRRIDDNESLVLIVENACGVSVDFNYGFRELTATSRR